MPRYDALNLRDVSLLNNPVPIFNKYGSFDAQNLPNYENLSADMRMDWSGDIIYDEKTQDFSIVFTVEAYVQRIYHRLVTQLGQFPESAGFGWDFTYLYSMNVAEQKRMLGRVVRDVEAAVKSDADTLSVVDVSAFIERIDRQSHNIVIEVSAKPKAFADVVVMTFELDSSEVRS